MNYSQIKGTVIKKGRKYFYVKLDTTQNDYQHKLLINEYSQNLNVGDWFELTAQPTWSEGYRTGKSYISLYTPVDPDSERQEEIARWMGYIQNAYKQGYIYEKGVEKLHELKANKELRKVRRMSADLAIERAVKKFVRYVEEYDKFESESWKYVHEFGSEDDIQKVEKANEDLEKAREEKRQQKIKEEEEKRSKGIFEKVRFGESELCQFHIASKGSIFEMENELYRVTYISQRKRADEDWGQPWDDYYRLVSYQRVTDAEDSDVIAYKKAKEQEIKQKEKQKRKEHLENQITKFIQNGIPIEKVKDVSAFMQTANEKPIWNTFNLYGSGEFCFVHQQEIYLVIGHTMDGDTWDANTISGVGYGWHRPLTPEIEHILSEYQAMDSEE